jgi:hypothetical protein
VAPPQRKELVVGSFASLKKVDEPWSPYQFLLAFQYHIGRSQLAVRQICLLTGLVRAMPATITRESKLSINP